MPCSVHTEPCSPGICGQQERLFPITGKGNVYTSIIGQPAARHSLSGTMLSDTLGVNLPSKSDCDFPSKGSQLI